MPAFLWAMYAFMNNKKSPEFLHYRLDVLLKGYDLNCKRSETAISASVVADYT